MRASYHKENQGRSEKERELRMVLFASLGLISHPLIFLSFFFTYIEYGSPYAATSPIPYTGWQLLGDAFHPQTSQRIADMHGWYPPLAAPLALALLVALILPALLYLACLLLLMTSVKWKNFLLRVGLVLCCWLNFIGFLLGFFWLLTSYGSAELHNPFQSIEPAFSILPAGFLLSLICCFLLRGSTQQLPEGSPM